MDNPSKSGADAAYDRALAAFQEKSYEVARRWVLESLAHNRQHAGARALLARLDAARAATSPFHAAASGSEVVSTDPTILISRASGPAPEAIEPTVMIRRDDPRVRPGDTDPRVVMPPIPPRARSRSLSEPTIIAQPKSRATTSPRSKSSFSLGGALQSLGERLQRTGNKQRSSSTGQARSTGSSLSTPAARGTAIAIGTVAVGALLVWMLFMTIRWIWPAGQVLTITKPTGGTITGPGVKCGTGGSQCSTTVTTGEPIELATEPDKGYVWTGFTGDCAPAGRTTMNAARTCGAMFGPVVSGGMSAAPATFRLTITKPTGGTIVAAGGILCGTNGSTCSADIPSGVPIDLVGNADDGYQFDQFTGDCPSTGKTMMTAAKTCGATFIPSAAPINRGTGPIGPPIATAPRPRPQNPPSSPSSGPTPAPTPTNQPSGTGPTNPSGTPGPTPLPPQPSPIGPDGPAKAPTSPEEHAKQEIGQLVKNYCAALQTLKPASVRSLFHLDNERDLKAQFKEYRSLKCSLTSQPEYDRLDAAAAGGAQLKFGMKQAIQMASGGAPKEQETIVTMVVSRKDFQSPWLIDRVSHEVKPK
jgi:hypothetical protein